ncbi:hypothetical protein [Proteus appendicitidis]|uniref:Uncharacterized protein n=1 Tax=Proteus appendicitidis TaxID=3034648 RepID=A0ABY8YA34_9GAMM|nr:hypothetical protein [Proteus sp. HZ0627]WIV89251.1 hypothetical protein QQS39_04330 [Proteus sp. HZ0627]
MGLVWISTGISTGVTRLIAGRRSEKWHTAGWYDDKTPIAKTPC